MDQTMTRTEKVNDLRAQIDTLVRELRDLQRDLQREDIENFLIDAKANVGRCFVYNHGGSSHKEYAIITDVPQVEHGSSGMSLNRCQFPCVILDADDLDDIVPFYSDTLYTQDGRNFPNWSEISRDEFNTQLLWYMSLFSRRIYNEDEGGADS